MKIKQPYLLLGLLATVGTLVLASFDTSDELLSDEGTCQLLHKGTFKYKTGNDKTAFFQIDGNKHMEYFQNKKYYVESKLTWVTACTYEMVPVKTNLPDFPFSEKDTMLVKIVSVKGSSIDFQGQIGEKSFDGTVEKVQ